MSNIQHVFHSSDEKEIGAGDNGSMVLWLNYDKNGMGVTFSCRMQQHSRQRSNPQWQQSGVAEIL
jgi:hypothetical protein